MKINSRPANGIPFDKPELKPPWGFMNANYRARWPPPANADTLGVPGPWQLFQFHGQSPPIPRAPLPPP